MESKKRTTKEQMLKDALAIRNRIAAGKRRVDIQREMGWTKDAFYRRYRLMLDMARESLGFGDDRVFQTFVQYKTRLEGIAMQSRAAATGLIKAGKHKAASAHLRVAAHCEDKILLRAMDLGIVPRAPQKSEIKLDGKVSIYDGMSDDELIEQARRGLEVLERNGHAVAASRN